MTTLLVQTLVSELKQDFNINLDERYHIGAIAPYLYLHNPSGTFTLTLKNGATSLASKSLTVAEIKALIPTTDNYAHVFCPFIFSSPTKVEKGSYTLSLTASGYSNSAASFIGWCQQFEDIQNEMDYLPSDDSENSLAFRFKIFKEGVL
jgi:hypothetical protein